MKLYRLSQLSEEEYRGLIQRSEADITVHLPLAQEVAEAVRTRGDEALLYYTRLFDGVELSRDRLKVPEEEMEKAWNKLDKKTRETLEYAAGNIRKFHREQLPREIWMKEIDRGILAGEKVTPIPSVSLYVPRGKGSFPSVMLMLGIPAVVAGVPRIAVCTPPGEGGEIEETTLGAAWLAGIKEVYQVGGMQAVAAVAYGTETVPRCRKILGPGNAYVNAARRLLYGVVDVGLPAGPSEAIILADGEAEPRLVALDLMIEAEHGPDSSALLVTPSGELAEKVQIEVRELLEALPPERRRFVESVFDGYGGIVLTESMDEAVEFVNAYAPEHMELITAEPFALLPRIQNAGEILLGPYTPITLCNFLMGPNAILPTGGFASTYSGLSVHDFLKRSSLGYVTEEGFNRVSEASSHFARMEGFVAHARAVEERKKRSK